MKYTAKKNHEKIPSLPFMNTKFIIQLIIKNYLSKQKKNYAIMYNIPVVVTNLITRFASNIFPCDQLLTTEEDYRFYQLIQNEFKKKIHKIQLIFKASDHNFETDEFHKCCDNKSPTITIVQSKYGNIFGGFTKIPWTSTGGWYRDPDAFIFLIRSNTPALTCPIIFPVKQNAAISSVQKSGPLFGYDITIGLWDKKIGYCGRHNQASTSFNYDTTHINISGGKNYFPINNYYVMSLNFAASKLSLPERTF